MKEINLFKIEPEVPEKERALVQKAKLFSLLLLVVYCLLIVGVFSFWIVLRKSDEKVTEKIDFQEKRIKELTEVESRHVFLKQRLTNLLPFFVEEKVEHKEVVERLEGFLPEGVVLEMIDFQEEGGLQFGGRADNAVVFAEFLDRLISSETDDFAESVRLASAARQEDGSYVFDLFLNVRI